MSKQPQILPNKTWNVRIEVIPEKEGKSHFFERIYLTLTAYFEENNSRYEFVRKVEDQIKNSTFLGAVDSVCSRLFNLSNT